MNIFKALATNIIFLLLFVQPVRSEIKIDHSGLFQIKQNRPRALVDTTNKQQLLEKVRKQGSIKVWVFYAMDYKPEGNLDGIQIVKQRETIQNMHRQFIRNIEKYNLQVRSINKMDREPRIAMFVDEEALKYFFKSSIVEKVEEVRLGKPYLSQSVSIINADNAWDLGFAGEGEIIVIIDTGVESNHEMLAGKVVDGACFSSNDWMQGISSLCPNGGNQDTGITAGRNCTGIQGCDHGTHVAGITVGNAQHLKGVANEAKIISIQVFSEIDNEEICSEDEGTPCLRYYADDLESALNYVYNKFYQQDNYNLAAVNMSLGGGKFSSECNTDLLTQSVNALVSAGISVVAASGNEGYSNALASPACIPNVISVGATNSQDTHWNESNAATFLDLVAPGVSINSSIPGDNYGAFTGTSQAAPHVSGTIAIMRAATPTLSVPQTRSILRNTAYWESSMNPNWPYDPPSNEYGYGRLDTYESLIGALNLNPNVLLPDYNAIYADQIFAGKDIYVQDNFILNLQGEVTLDIDQSFNNQRSSLNVLGILAGPSSASLNLIDDSQLNIFAGGLNNYYGDINLIIRNELTFTEDTTIKNGYNLNIESGGTLKLTEGVTFGTELGVEMKMEPNTKIIFVEPEPSGLTKVQNLHNSSYPSEASVSINVKNKGTHQHKSNKIGLNSNYPNPFNPITVIRYEIPISNRVELVVFDLLGRKVATLVDDQVLAGEHEVYFDASNLSSGIYIYSIRVNDFIETKQMTVIK